jgi:TetR/AcrR family transcriptional repressor of nem operon
MAARGGRPRGFERETALRAAVDVFWARGYAATSLDDLLAAMGIARSSFYAAWGSKHAVLLAALDLYTDELFARLRDAAASSADPREALGRVLGIAACSERPDHGCLFVNAATELAADDADVHALARAHLARVDRLVASLFRKAGRTAAEARKESGLLMAVATGALTLRKAGEPEARIRETLGRYLALAV